MKKSEKTARLQLKAISIAFILPFLVYFLSYISHIIQSDSLLTFLGRVIIALFNMIWSVVGNLMGILFIIIGIIIGVVARDLKNRENKKDNTVLVNAQTKVIGLFWIISLGIIVARFWFNYPFSISGISIFLIILEIITLIITIMLVRKKAKSMKKYYK